MYKTQGDLARKETILFRDGLYIDYEFTKYDDKTNTCFRHRGVTTMNGKQYVFIYRREFLKNGTIVVWPIFDIIEK
jgi:hypothetical protein